MKFALAAFATAASCLVAACSAKQPLLDDPILLPPLASKQGLPEKMMIFVPGGAVPVKHYNATAKAIQAATELNMWVGIVACPANLCDPQDRVTPCKFSPSSLPLSLPPSLPPSFPTLSLPPSLPATSLAPDTAAAAAARTLLTYILLFIRS